MGMRHAARRARKRCALRAAYRIPAALAALLLGVAGCAALPASERAPEACWPHFPYAEGWLGGDAAYSVPVSEARSIWLFGDTFVGRPAQTDRAGAHFVHNSVGVSQCRSGRWSMRYFWGAGPDGAPQAFLERSGSGGWWWLFDGFVHGGELFIGLLEVEPGPARGPLGLPFRFSGVQLARVRNPAASPPDWTVEVLPLSRNERGLTAGAMVVHESHVYVFGFLDQGEGRFPRMLTRLPLAALDGEDPDPAGALEYLARDGRWKPGLDPEDARVLMSDNATELSVRYHPALQRWLALYSYPDVGPGFPETRPSDVVKLRTAQALEGPWSPPSVIFRVPQLDPDYAGGFDPHTACYAAKEQRQFSGSDSLTFTYVCNLFTPPGGDPMAILERLVKDMNLYRPTAVRLELPRGLRIPSRPGAASP